MTRTERISITMSAVALVCAVATLVMIVMTKASPATDRAMRLAATLDHFNDKQFDAIIKLLDRGMTIEASAMTDEVLKNLDTDLDSLAMMGAPSMGAMNQISEARNEQRRSDVNTILNALFQYAIDNAGKLPPDITGVPTEACSAKTTAECAGKIDLHMLLDTYLVAIPRDPKISGASSGTRYFISRDADGKLTVYAPDTENDPVISVTR